MKNFVLLLFYFLPLSLFAQLQVTQVEPPNWWVGMQWQELQLMLYGNDLDGLQASFKEPALEVTAIHTLPNTSYAFIDLRVPADLPPGTYHLELQRGKETVEVPYRFLARENAEGKYQGFNQRDVFYLITPDRFANGDPSNDKIGDRFADYDPAKAEKRHGGDLAGIIAHLDYLQDLGITTLWLNPVLENDGENSYHGYAATDLYQIDARFGSNEQYRQLVQEAHRRGLKVVFDHVANHIGINHPWMSNLPTPDWVNGTAEKHLDDKHYKLSVLDPYAAADTEELLRSFWFVDAMPDLNQRNPFLANYLIQNSLWWIEYTGMDGIREDTYPYPFQSFLTRWEKAILAEYPQFNIVGEIWTNEPAVVAAFQKDSYLKTSYATHLPSVMDFPLSDALREYLEGKEKLKKVYSIFAQDFLYSDPSNLFTFIDNHDMTRAYYVAKKNTAKVKQALTILLSTRGIPQLLYGTEINMYGGESHVELREDFPGGFPTSTHNAFEAMGRDSAETDIFNFLQKLLKLRQQYPALADGQFIQFPGTWGNDIYKYLKRGKKNTFLVILKGHDEERMVDLSELKGALAGASKGRDLWSDQEFSLDKNLRIAAYGTMVLKLTPQ